MVAESTRCPNCKRLCTVREGLWRKVTCVNSTCRTKFLIQVSPETEFLIKSAEEKVENQSSFQLWQPSCALPPLRASDPELEAEGPNEPIKKRSKIKTTSKIQSQRLRNKLIVCGLVALFAIPSAFMLTVFSLDPEFQFHHLVNFNPSAQKRPTDSGSTELSKDSGDSQGSIDSSGSKSARRSSSTGGSPNSSPSPQNSTPSTTSKPSATSSETPGTPKRVVKTPAESQADPEVLKLLDLSYSTINAINTHPDAPIANQLVKDWQQSYSDRFEKLASQVSVAAFFRAIDENLKQAVSFLTVELREAAEVAEAKIRFCESLRNATKNADRIWAITSSSSGSTQASTRFQHDAIKFIKEVRTIASALKAINASNPGDRVADDMNEFSRRLTEKFAFFSAIPQDSQFDSFSLKTINDCFLRATKTCLSIHSIRTNPENEANRSSEEMSRLVQLFYADLRLGQDLIDLEESVLTTWKQQETLVRMTGRK